MKTPDNFIQDDLFIVSSNDQPEPPTDLQEQREVKREPARPSLKQQAEGIVDTLIDMPRAKVMPYVGQIGLFQTKHAKLYKEVVNVAFTDMVADHNNGEDDSAADLCEILTILEAVGREALQGKKLKTFNEIKTALDKRSPQEITLALQNRVLSRFQKNEKGELHSKPKAKAKPKKSAPFVPEKKELERYQNNCGVQEVQRIERNTKNVMAIKQTVQAIISDFALADKLLSETDALLAAY